jgi:hypothetical protein
MKRNLPSLFLLLAAVTACWWVARIPRNQLSAPADTRPDSTSPIASGVPALLVSASPGESLTAEQLLRASSRELRSIEGLEAAVKLDIELLGQHLSGAGTYLQAGQGTPRSRWDLEFQLLPDSLRMVQLFDGRFHYLYREQGEERSLTLVDQYRIPGLADSNTPALPGPASWFGTGGLPVLLDQLAATFELEVVSTSERKSRSGRTMRLATLSGKWKPAALQQLLRGQIDPARIGKDTRPDDLPAQMPCSVELVLGSDDYLELFPYQITVHFADNSGSSRGGSIAWKLHHVTRRDVLDPQAFELSTGDVVAVDQSDDYIARLEMYLHHPVE